MMFSQCNTCSMVIYLTIQYQGECGHIEGHAYTTVFFSWLPEALHGLMTKQTFRKAAEGSEEESEEDSEEEESNLVAGDYGKPFLP